MTLPETVARTRSQLDSFVPLEPEVVSAMFDLADIRPGERHIDLGAGDGRFVIEAMKRGAYSEGYEIDRSLVAQCQGAGLNVWPRDLFDADVSKADTVSFWFTMQPGVTLLMNKLYREMPMGSRLVMLYDSLSTTGGRLDHVWQPTRGGKVLGNQFWLYVR